MKNILREFDKLAKINQLGGIEGYQLGNGETVKFFSFGFNHEL
jgi:hypothetical protein